MLIKIGVCLHTWLCGGGGGGGDQWQDNIRAATSREAVSFKAEKSGRMLWICHAGFSECSVRIQQWAWTYVFVVFSSGKTLTLAPCGSLLNLMIHARASTSTHMLFWRQCLWAPDRLSDFHGNSRIPLLACQWAFVMPVIPRNDNSNFSCHRFSFSSPTIAVA